MTGDRSARAIDHIVYGTTDLDAACARLERRLGVRAAGGGEHPGQGTHNRLLALGPTTYLEVVAPDPGQPEPAASRPYGVDGITHDAVVGWALTCPDLPAGVARARSRGLDPGDIVEGRRRTVTGTLLRWSLTGNALAAGLIPFLIDWGSTPHPAAAAPAGLVLDSLHLEHPDPAVIGPPLHALGADVEVRPGPRPAIVVRLSGPGGSIELR